jgi:hypothetical protein
LTRRHKNTPDAVTIEVDGQPFLVRAMSERSLHVDTPREGITIRGVQLKGSDNFLLQEDGRWISYSEANRQSIYLKRVDRNYPQDEATPAGRKTFTAMLTRAVEAFLMDHRDDLVRAQAADANNRVERLDKEIDEAQAKIDGLLASRRKHERREAAALAEISERGLDAETGGPRP